MSESITGLSQRLLQRLKAEEEKEKARREEEARKQSKLAEKLQERNEVLLYLGEEIASKFKDAIPNIAKATKFDVRSFVSCLQYIPSRGESVEPAEPDLHDGSEDSVIEIATDMDTSDVLTEMEGIATVSTTVSEMPSHDRPTQISNSIPKVSSEETEWDWRSVYQELCKE